MVGASKFQQIAILSVGAFSKQICDNRRWGSGAWISMYNISKIINYNICFEYMTFEVRQLIDNLNDLVMT